MTKRLVVETTGDIWAIPNLKELMPQEIAVVGELKAEGILESLMLKDGSKGAFFVCCETDQAKVEAALKRLPFYPYFKQIEYTLVDKNF